MTKMKDLESIIEKNKQIILTGPPGTSKTYTAKRIAAVILKISLDEVEKEEDGNDSAFSKARYSEENKNGFWSIVQFHPAYNYEDFVRGIQVTTYDGKPEYKTVDRILGLIADTANQKWEEWRKKDENKDKNHKEPDDSCPKYVLIIDEINRANLAAVLGELIYALEYRGCKVNTPYRVNESRDIIIPPNLYIIGTMNTADRSIGHIDYAVRRRFAFIPLLPDYEQLNSYDKYENEETKDFALVLFKCVKSLFENGGNNALSDEFYPDDVQPGHTYFMAKDNHHLIQKFVYQVYPLLREYFKDGVLKSDADPVLSLGEYKVSLSNPFNAVKLTEMLFNYWDNFKSQREKT